MKKLVIPDEKKPQIIKLRDLGKSWSEIQDQTGISRHACKKYYLEWQRESLADDKMAIRRSLAEEYLKEHLELQVDFAGQLLELLPISRSKVPNTTPREQLYPLWNTNRWLQKSEEGIQPVVYPKTEGVEVPPRLRLIRGQNNQVYQSLKDHTRGQVRWQAFTEWQSGWMKCHVAVQNMKNRIVSRLSEEIGDPGSGNQIWKSIHEQVKGKVEEEMVQMIWEALIISYVDQELYGINDLHEVKALAAFLTGARDELVIPSLYLSIKELVGLDIISTLVKDLCGSDDIKQLAENIKKVAVAYRELEETLNPMVLRPLLLRTHCQLCPV